MTWSLRYTLHLGYAPPDFGPQFAATVGTSDPGSLIRFAADLEVAGILYPWALTRPKEEIEAVASTLADTKLACSCIVALPPELVTSPVWTDRSATNRDRLRLLIAQAATTANRLGSTLLAVVIGSDQDRMKDAQFQDVAANLRDAGDVAADHGLELGVEPIVLLPNMLLTTTRSTVELLSEVDHSAVGMIFDTGHIFDMDHNILESFHVAAAHIKLFQFADMPGRIEPNEGAADLIALAAALVHGGYDGLVDLEHGWADNSRDGEAAGLARLRSFDRAVSAAAKASNLAAPYLRTTNP